MKVLFNKSLSTTTSPSIPEGRHVGTVIHIAGLGDHPAFNAGSPPAACIGVVIQLANGQVTKKMTLTENPMGTLHSYLKSTLPDPDYVGDDPIPLTLGRPVAVEITANGKFTNIASFHQPESFELSDAPRVASTDLLMLEGPESLTGDEGKALFLKLHRDIRSWLSKRIRSN